MCIGVIACSLSGLAPLSCSFFFFFFFEIEDIHFIQCLLPASCRSHSFIFKKFSHYVSAAIDEKVSFRFQSVSKIEDTFH